MENKLQAKIEKMVKMNNEELVKEYCRMVTFTANNNEAMLGIAGDYEEAIKAEMLRRMK